MFHVVQRGHKCVGTVGRGAELLNVVVTLLLIVGVLAGWVDKGGVSEELGVAAIGAARVLTRDHEVRRNGISGGVVVQHRFASATDLLEENDTKYIVRYVLGELYHKTAQNLS